MKVESGQGLGGGLIAAARRRRRFHANYFSVALRRRGGGSNLYDLWIANRVAAPRKFSPNWKSFFGPGHHQSRGAVSDGLGKIAAKFRVGGWVGAA
jgi:hypothetical protein